MAASFIPTNFAKLSLWCLNYKTQIGINGKVLGLTDDEIFQQQTLCDLMVAAIADADAKTLASAAANKNRGIVFKNQIGELKKNISHLKSAPLMTGDLKTLFDIAPKTNVFDDSNYKGTLTAEMYAGIVRLKFKKLGVDGVNIYHRKKGDLQFAFLIRATKSPFDDKILLTTPNQPEHWEYRSLGVINDKEIGQPSDIIEILFGG